MKRFNCTLADKRGEFGECMEAHNTGRYVLFSDVDKLQRRMQEMLDKSNSTGVAIERAISTGAVPADHPLKSRLELLANHHKREQALADGMVAMADRCKLLTDLLREARNPLITAMEASSEDESTAIEELIDRIDALLAGQLPELTSLPDCTEVTRTAPKRIWLQVSDDFGDHNEPFPTRDELGNREVTWCADSVGGTQIEYLRADLAHWITKPARIGGVVFQPGVKVATVIEAAYRSAENYQQCPAKFQALQHAILGKLPELSADMLREIQLTGPVVVIDKPGVSEGWQLVPVEPTMAMISAATAATTGFGTRAQWDAMLAAAPKPEGGEPCAIEPPSSSPA
ncbi:hypothetical protein ACB274_06100 [Aeromonas sanarellii]